MALWLSHPRAGAFLGIANEAHQMRSFEAFGAEIYSAPLTSQACQAFSVYKFMVQY